MVCRPSDWAPKRTGLFVDASGGTRRGTGVGHSGAAFCGAGLIGFISLGSGRQVVFGVRSKEVTATGPSSDCALIAGFRTACDQPQSKLDRLAWNRSVCRSEG